MDKYELAAAKVMGHEDCPHWMDDNHFCRKCDNLRPVIAALREAAAEVLEAKAAAMRKSTSRLFMNAMECGTVRRWAHELERDAAALRPAKPTGDDK